MGETQGQETATQETATDSAQSTTATTQEEEQTMPATQESTTPKSPKGQIHDIRLSSSQERLGTIRNRRDAFKCARLFRDGTPEKTKAFLPAEDVEKAIRLLGNKKTSVQIVQYERNEEDPESRATIEEVFSLSPRVKKEEKKEESAQEDARAQETTPPAPEKKTTPKKTTTRKTSSEETHQSAKRAA